MPALPPITTTICPASCGSRRSGEGVAVLMDSSSNQYPNFFQGIATVPITLTRKSDLQSNPIWNN
jgi:hypothetical protein